VIGFILVLSYFLAFSSLFSYVISEGVSIYLLGGIAALSLLVIYFEFGLKIIKRSLKFKDWAAP
jgi:hypothetical protein